MSGMRKIDSQLKQKRMAKRSVPSLESMSKSEQVAYFTQQLENAKKRLEQMIAMKDEKGAQRTQDIINNLQSMIGRYK